MTEKITVSQYAKIRNITVSAVNKAIRETHRLPGVLKVKKMYRMNFLYCDKKILDQMRIDREKSKLGNSDISLDHALQIIDNAIS